MSDTLLNNAPVTQLRLINILNVMYTENTRQIQQLNEANNEIRNVITTLLYSQINNNNVPSSLFPTSTTNTHTGTNRNTHNSSNRTTYNGNNRNTNNNTNPLNRNRNTHNNNNNRTPTSTNNSTVNNNANRRIYIDNIPYLIENIRHYNIPNRVVGSQTNLGESTAHPRTTTRNLASTIGSFLDPVVIYPTQTQIELSTRNVRYCDILTPINLSCPISLENFNDSDMVTVIRFCGHIFSTGSLNTWFTTNCRCPVCRYDIRNYNSNNSVGNRVPSDEPVRRTTSQVLSEDSVNMNVNSVFNNYLYSFINEDVSGNTNISDAEALLNLITSLQGSIS